MILPAHDYRHSVVRQDEVEVFDHLLGKARRVRHAPFPSAGRPAFQAASEMLLRECDLLFGEVWDGDPSREPGDTADVVHTARKSGVEASRHLAGVCRPLRQLTTHSPGVSLLARTSTLIVTCHLRDAAQAAPPS